MPSFERLTMAQALIRFLAVQRVERDGVETPFFGPVLGIFGHGNVGGIGEALEAFQDQVRFIPFRNEQAMVHTAAGYAWMKRRLGALACTTSIGPGATNLVTGAAGATINRLPVLLLPGDVFASRRVRPVLQQLEAVGSQSLSVNDALRPVSRFWDRLDRPEQLLASLPEAMRVLTSPAETGSVTLALPQDTQAEAHDYPVAFLEPRVWHVARPEPEPAALARLAQMIRDASRPMFVAGGGVRYSSAEVELGEMASAWAIPVGETQAGKGTLPWDHSMNLGAMGATGGLAANDYAAQADLVIAVGTRLGDFTTASWSAWPAQGVGFASINVDAADAAKAGGLAVVADARQALRQLIASLGPATDGAAERRLLVDTMRTRWNSEVEAQLGRRASDARLTQAQVIAAVNDSVMTNTAAGGTVVNAAGSMPGDLHKVWRATSSDDYNVEYGYSCMGYEIPGGLGIKLAQAERRVHVLIGDGSYLMLNSEIVTSIQEHLPLTIVLVDTHGYRSISSLAASMGARNNFNVLRQRDEQTGRLDGAPPQIDFVGHAASMGARALRVTTAEELRSALSDAQGADITTVVVVEVDAEIKVPGYESWWDVPVAEVSSSPTVRAAREEYERALARQSSR